MEIKHDQTGQVAEAVLLDLHQFVARHRQISQKLKAAKGGRKRSKLIAIGIEFEQFAKKTHPLRQRHQLIVLHVKNFQINQITDTFRQLCKLIAS